MRTLWSQVSRPNLAGTFTSARSAKQSEATTASVARVLARRTTTAPAKRRLTFNDAFTLLLTPVFGTAFVIDTSWKEKQRKEWERKLADVNGEIAELHARAQRYSSLSDAVLYNARRQQLREYSTVSRFQSQPEPFQSGIVDDPEEWHYGQAPAEDEHSHYNDDRLHNYSPEELADAFRFHRLVATLCALRMLTHFQLSVTPRFVHYDDRDIIRGDRNSETEELDSQMNINQLVDLTKHTRSQIRLILDKQLDLRGMASVIEDAMRKDSFQNRMRQSFDDMMARNCNVYTLVQTFAEGLAQNPQSVPSSVTYSHFLHVLCNSKYEGTLAYYVVSALKSSELPLDDRTIYTLITHLGKTRDFIQFDAFLQGVMRKPPAHYFNTKTPWVPVRFKGISVPTPANLNSQILKSLVRTAVKCGQMDKADAWFSSLQDGGSSSKVKAHLLYTFLRHYSLTMNWEHGRIWIATCLDNVVSFLSAVTSNVISVFIFRMLDLCVACERASEYTVILQAAVDAGLPPPETNPDFPVRYTHRGLRILEEWRALSIHAAFETPTDELKVRKFASLCAPIIETISKSRSASFQGVKPQQLAQSAQDNERRLAMVDHRKTTGQYETDSPKLRHDSRESQTSAPIVKSNNFDVQMQAKIAETQGLLELSQQRLQEQNNLINELKQQLAAKEREHNEAMTASRQHLHHSEVVVHHQAKRRETPRRLPGALHGFAIDSKANYSTFALRNDRQYSHKANSEWRTSNRPNDSVLVASLDSQDSNVDSDVLQSKRSPLTRSDKEPNMVTVGYSHPEPSVSELLFGEHTCPPDKAISAWMSSNISTDEFHPYDKNEAPVRLEKPDAIPHGNVDFRGPVYPGKASDLTAEHRFDLSQVGKALPEAGEQRSQGDVVSITRHFVGKRRRKDRGSPFSKKVRLPDECYATNDVAA
ncbi:hypothetical protein B0A52_05360 [Exophiala mesophila]|uniref:Uncharacterized protein n=1 Tax=Exophiala mesophila TaxID=212818 RepID=A0A438N578_EXOME|nr:hypothetical protein B0A52_05360 [Exophiala mesophila]